MLKNIMVVILFSLFSCKSTEYTKEQPECPKGYECDTEVLKNKSISILKDSIDEIYIKFNEDETHNIIKYTYKYSGQPNIADDTYVETFYFQVPKDVKNISLKDKELKSTIALAQKSCFCPDAGFQIIEQGQLNIQKRKGAYYVKFQHEPDRNMKVKTIETQVKI